MTECCSSKYGRCGRIVAFVLLLPLAVAVAGLVTQGLWNALMPSIFGLKALHFWQAVGLLILGRLLFGGFHGCHGRHRDRRHAWGPMTPEERERLRSGWRGRFCCGPEAPGGEPDRPGNS